MPKKVYPELNTVVAMCEKTLLSTAQKLELAEAPSFDEASAMLSSWNFYATGDTEDFKTGLEKEKAYWLDKFGKIAPECFIRLFTLHDELHDLKIFVKEELLASSEPGLYIPFCKADREFFSALSEKKDRSEYEEKLLSFINELKADYEKHSSLVRLDLLTSFFEMTELNKYAALTGDCDVAEAVRVRTDLDLISLALVSKGKNVPYSDSVFAKFKETGSSLDFKKLLTSSDEENLKALSKTKYAQIYKSSMTPEGRVKFDADADNVIISLCKKAKYQPFGLFMVYAFLYSKMSDIKNVRTALLAKASGSDAGEIKERMRDTYEL